MSITKKYQYMTLNNPFIRYEKHLSSFWVTFKPPTFKRWNFGFVLLYVSNMISTVYKIFSHKKNLRFKCNQLTRAWIWSFKSSCRLNNCTVTRMFTSWFRQDGCDTMDYILYFSLAVIFLYIGSSYGQ